MMMMLVPCVCVNRKCAVIKRFRRFVVEKASSSFPLFSVFWQTKSKKKKTEKTCREGEKTKEALSSPSSQKKT